MSLIKAFIADVGRLAMFIGALLLIKFWYLALPLLLAGAYFYGRYGK